MPNIFAPNPKWDNDNRKTPNMEICKLLYFTINQYPSMRFSQILKSLDIDSLNPMEESKDTLKRVKKAMESLK